MINNLPIYFLFWLKFVWPKKEKKNNFKNLNFSFVVPCGCLHRWKKYMKGCLFFLYLYCSKYSREAFIQAKFSLKHNCDIRFYRVSKKILFYQVISRIGELLIIYFIHNFSLNLLFCQCIINQKTLKKIFWTICNYTIIGYTGIAYLHKLNNFNCLCLIITYFEEQPV